MTDNDQNRMETMGVRLGYLGLLPFVAGAVAALLSNELASFALQPLSCTHWRFCRLWVGFTGAWP